MVNVDPSTEEKILAAARTVFHKRGFDGARMKEIADSAGINKALLHYYFRSKENLFNAVFAEAATAMIGTISSIFTGSGPLEDKLERFYDFHITFLQEHSYLPWFLINGLHEKPDEIKAFFSKNDFRPQEILTQVVENLKKEGFEVDDPLQMFANILSLSIFPIIAQPLLSHFFSLSGKDLDLFYEQRKRYLARFVINGLNLRKKE